jgi:hypothetical protein
VFPYVSLLSVERFWALPFVWQHCLDLRLLIFFSYRPLMDLFNNGWAIGAALKKVMLTSSAPLKQFRIIVPVLLFVLAALAMNVRPATSDATEGVILMKGFDLHVLPISGGDVIANNVSITLMNVTISNVNSQINAIKADNSAIKANLKSLTAENSAMKAGMSILAAQFNAFVSQAVATSSAATAATVTATSTATTPPTTTTSTTSVASSACLVSRSPQQLATSFETFATFTSTDSTVYLIAEQDTQSVLYKYDGNGTFISYQTLWSATDTTRVHTFQLDSIQYVAVPFYYDGTTYEYRCELFFFNETTKLLVSAQNISTFGVSGVSVVTTHTGSTYMAVSNFRNQAESYTVFTYIMRHNNSSKLFEHFQNISTLGAYPLEFLQFGADTFLAIPSEFDGTAHLLNSTIYKLDALSGLFSLNQSISTDGASHMKPWTRNAQQYLSVVNRFGGYTDIFVFDSVQGQFVNVTNGNRLYSSSPNGADVIDIEGSAYMVVAPWGTDARIYQWNDALTRFEQTQQISVTSDWLFPRFFTIGTDAFLALSDRIYQFCGGMFVLV